ncbi:MAG: hemerythrin family protein [Gammaproteobacteria bacterium]|nr:hemerythrin family protein [Gammaproteobacteria bacterium]
MTRLQWRDEYSIGIADIDYEHRELIGLINDLIDGIAEDSADAVMDHLGEIYARIAAHFALEEKIMRERNYDQYADHKADHDRLLDAIRDIMDEYDDDASLDNDEFVDRLDHWFTDHFRTKDARMHKQLSTA